MKLFALAASLRRGSFNRKLIALAAEAVRAQGVEVAVHEFAEFDVPLYNADVQRADGIPSGATRFGDLLGAHDGFLLSSPEYNYSIPGTVKNLIDWVSRIRPVPFRGRHAFLMSASTSYVGGQRGLWALRVPLECLGVLVHPDMYSLPQANEAFDEAGALQESARRERLQRMLEGYVSVARRLAVPLPS